MSTLARLSIVLVFSGALIAVGSTSASAAPGSSPLAGTITITGSDGRDDLEVDIVRSGTRVEMRITPAVTVTATSGNCPPETDPITGRPTHNVCALDNSNPISRPLALVIDLRGGDDRVAVEDRIPVPATRGIGGPGDDTISLFAAVPTSRTLEGSDGNDVLASPGPLSGNPRDKPTAYTGGSGTDTVDLSGATLLVGAVGEIGANASLQSNTAIFAGVGPTGRQTTFRTDTLSSIETLSGSEVGDVLTGSPGPDTLIGNDGNDNLSGESGADSLLGGDDLDNLNGGRDSDSIDGGLGIDLYPSGGGLDTYNTRDGYKETITCVNRDVIIDDLVDTVTSPTTCLVSTAAAKHRYDTRLSGHPAKLSGGGLKTRVRCPARKTEACEGRLEALLRHHALGRAAYELRPGERAGIRLPVSKADARRVAGKRIVLAAKEIDANGRDRFVSRPTRVLKAGPGG